MTVRGEKSAAMLPEQRPDRLPVGLRDVQRGQFSARKKRKVPSACGSGVAVSFVFTSNKNISQCAWPAEPNSLTSPVRCSSHGVMTSPISSCASRHAQV